jgi:hypothetical protein
MQRYWYAKMQLVLAIEFIAYQRVNFTKYFSGGSDRQYQQRGGGSGHHDRRGGGGGGRGGRQHLPEVEAGPKAEDKLFQNIYSSGINFDKYEDIPVRWGQFFFVGFDLGRIQVQMFFF